jgi:hypothetical protein
MSQGELDPEVPVDDPSSCPVDEDLADPADLGQGSTERSLLIERVGTPVARVGHEIGWRDVSVAHDSRAPRRCRRDGAHAD